MKKEFKRVPCELVGEDGNAFAVMSRVAAALKKHGYADLVPEYQKKATSGDYNNLLAVSMEYVVDVGPDEDDEDDKDDEYEYDSYDYDDDDDEEE